MRFLSSLVNSPAAQPEAGVDVLFVGNAWVVPAVKLEKHVPYAGVFCVIISEFRYR